jgi:hypothetical protein
MAAAKDHAFRSLLEAAHRHAGARAAEHAQDAVMKIVTEGGADPAAAQTLEMVKQAIDRSINTEGVKGRRHARDLRLVAHQQGETATPTKPREPTFETPKKSWHQKEPCGPWMQGPTELRSVNAIQLDIEPDPIEPVTAIDADAASTVVHFASLILAIADTPNPSASRSILRRVRAAYSAMTGHDAADHADVTRVRDIEILLTRIHMYEPTSDAATNYRDAVLNWNHAKLDEKTVADLVKRSQLFKSGRGNKGVRHVRCVAIAYVNGERRKRGGAALREAEVWLRSHNAKRGAKKKKR